MSASRLSVLLAGESWVTHTVNIMGTATFSECGYGQADEWLRRAIEGAGHAYTYIPNHLAAEGFPATAEALAAYDAIILSDVCADTLLLHPNTKVLSQRTPNRLRLLHDYVRDGGGLLMIGGYLSFQGKEGKGGYYATPIEDALPVTMLPGLDDRVEVPEGFQPTVVDGAADHEILMGIPPTLPPMLFYNRVRLKPEAQLLLHFDDAPILAVWEYGAGRTAAFTPDAAPHGATPEFLEWEHFDQFVAQLIEWVCASPTCE